MNLGVISDTHGLLRPEAVAALRGSELILHAGDVGSPSVLERLSELAPVVAIRGNCDEGAWAEALPETETLALGAMTLCLIHDLKQLNPAGDASGVDVVISGHTHQPRVETRGGVLYLNPGSAGRRRFKLPITLARLTLSPAGASAEIVHLLDR